MRQQIDLPLERIFEVVQQPKKATEVFRRRKVVEGNAEIKVALGFVPASRSRSEQVEDADMISITERNRDALYLGNRHFRTVITSGGLSKDTLGWQARDSC